MWRPRAASKIRNPFIYGRYRRKSAFVLLFVLLLLVWTRAQNSQILPNWPGSDSHLYLDSLAQTYDRSTKLKHVQIQSTIYEDFFSERKAQKFLKTNSLQDRCSAYFGRLQNKDPNWKIDPRKILDYTDVTEGFRPYKEYSEEKLKGVRQKQIMAEMKKQVYEGPTKESVSKEFQELRAKIHADEQTLHDYVTHVRIFNKCFMGVSDAGVEATDASFVDSQRSALGAKTNDRKNGKGSDRFAKRKPECNQVARRAFPWLTLEYPTFTKWDGSSVFFPGSDAGAAAESTCFLRDYKARLNGRGIVMTLSDKHIDAATRFVRLLRHSGNNYPIQVVYHSDLSEMAKKYLIRAARDEFRGFPKQDLWFVDASGALEPEYKDKLGGFTNKVVATLFNSFEEMLLCDADAVLFKEPAYFFNLKKYIDTGTMFYKDRATGSYKARGEITFFKKLLPSVADTAVFNIPQTSAYTLDNDYFQGFTFMMESGVVAVNRKTHFIQPLMMATMDFYQVVRGRMHGDKELFWLALVLSGDESYAINKHYAAAVGEPTPDEERLVDKSKNQTFRSTEICSNHPAHISDEDDHTLVWMNSGFRHCITAFDKGLNYEEEANRKTRYSHLKTASEFETFYKAQLKITHAIVPPLKYQDSDVFNSENEPQWSWFPIFYCSMYCWCAYSSYGGRYTHQGVSKDSFTEGVLIKYTPEEIQHFDMIAEVWLADFEWSNYGM